jgi:hypothetical protein
MGKASASFRVFRLRAMIAAGLLAVVGVSGIFLVVGNERHLSDGLTAALLNVAAVLASIGVISLVYEVFLRETYAVELRSFVRIGAAVVSSGLQRVEPRSNVDWHELLESSSEIDILLRDPTVWVASQQEFVIREARRRAFEITLAVPASGKNFATMAESVGLTPEELRQRINISVSQLAGVWRTNAQHNQIHGGSRLRIVEFEDPLDFDMIRAGRHLVCLLNPPRKSVSGDDQVLLAFEQDESLYPTLFLARAFEDLPTLTAVEEING